MEEESFSRCRALIDSHNSTRAKKKMHFFSSCFPPPSTQTCLNKQKIHKGITWYAQVGKSEEKPDLESALPAQRLHIPPPIATTCQLGVCMLENATA